MDGFRSAEHYEVQNGPGSRGATLYPGPRGRGGGDRPRRQRLRPVDQPDIPEDQGGGQRRAWAMVSGPLAQGGNGPGPERRGGGAAGADDRRPLGTAPPCRPGTPRPRPPAGEPWPSTTGGPAGGKAIITLQKRGGVNPTAPTEPSVAATQTRGLARSGRARTWPLARIHRWTGMDGVRTAEAG